MSEREELGAILRTIREVEESLDRRAQRAAGVNLMIWGLVSASIFVFYQLATWNHEAYHAAFDPALPWLWIAPIALGYVASALVGARLGRFGADRGAWRDYRRGMIPGVIVTILAVVLILTQRAEWVAGALVFTIGVCLAVYAERNTFRGRVFTGVGAAVVVAGGALFVYSDADWTSLAAAFAMGLPLFALGAWLYGSAR